VIVVGLEQGIRLTHAWIFCAMHLKRLYHGQRGVCLALTMPAVLLDRDLLSATCTKGKEMLGFRLTRIEGRKIIVSNV
jgi:hypothetical protein